MGESEGWQRRRRMGDARSRPFLTGPGGGLREAGVRIIPYP